MVVHLTFSLHLHAFGLALASGWLVVAYAAWTIFGYTAPGLAEGWLVLVPLGIMTVYLAAALRTTFSLTRRAATVQALGVGIAHWFLATMLAIGYALVPWIPGGPPTSGSA